MPLRKRAKKAPRRKRVIRGRKRMHKRGNPHTTIQRQLVTADRQFVKLRYIDVSTPTIGSVALAYAYNQYKLNSAYDVNSAIGSTAMPGFSEWATLYGRYRVHFTSIKCSFTNLVNNKPFLVGIYLQPSTVGSALTSWATTYDLICQPYVRTRVISSEGGMDRASLKQASPVYKLWGSKQQYLGDDNFAAATSASPTFLLNGYVFMCTMDNTAIGVNAAVACQTVVTMYVEFYQRLYLTT